MRTLSCIFFALLLKSIFFPVLSAQGIYQLWGMTSNGGSDKVGTIFSVDPSKDDVYTRHEFKALTPGYDARGNLTEYMGRFYGMTSAGGANHRGVIFEWDPVSNIFAKKIDLSDATGAKPFGSLTVKDGKFYGMTYSGGANGRGVIFEWDPVSNVYTKKIDLSNAMGTGPWGSLTLKDGKFYGMTYGGGANDRGVIFEWDPVSNVYTKKIDLSDATGANPSGSLTLKDGKFYGMTSTGDANGSGVIFEWDPVSNVYAKKIELSRNSGAWPLGSLTLKDGKFYGMTYGGGVNSRGAIFEWDPSTNIYTKKIDLSNATGYEPYGSLTLHNGRFYGMTSRNFPYSELDGGVIFEWDPATNIYTRKIELTLETGSLPMGDLTIKDGVFYGMTSMGRPPQANQIGGAIFSWDPQTNYYHRRISFNSADNRPERNTLTMYEGKLLGITSGGGTYDYGSIFEWDLSTSKFVPKFEFTLGNNGRLPQYGMTPLDGKFYGVAAGGTGGSGVIFEWDPGAGVYTRKIDLSYEAGSGPSGSLTLNDGKFYGMTSGGGANHRGIIFEWDPVSNVYTKKIDLSGGIGEQPVGSLVFKDGKFYGMTWTGGANGKGVIFEWDPVANIYVKKVDLSDETGSYPSGSLTLKDEKLYGMTGSGGANGRGVIFEWDPVSNVYTKKIELSDATGSGPYGSLTLKDGKFYGKTNSGGTNGGGTLFEWNPQTNVYRNIVESLSPNHAIGDLITAPAPVAAIDPGECIFIASITIDGSNNNSWVPVTDLYGNAVAEINANGNNLGQVSVWGYVHDGTTREDVANRLYLDRNLTISAENPDLSAGTNVSVRLYIKKEEYDRLAASSSSDGAPSGITSIYDLTVFKSSYDDCTAGLEVIAERITATAAPWGDDFVFTANISSFSTFYFAGKANTSLPVTLKSFNAEYRENAVQLQWETALEQNSSHFEIERSLDGKAFKTISSVAAHQQGAVYRMTDAYLPGDRNTLYYRLKSIDVDGSFSHSPIVSVELPAAGGFAVYPNPVTDLLAIDGRFQENTVWKIVDLNGRVIMQGNDARKPIKTGSVPSGVYMLQITGDGLARKVRFVKE